MNCEAHIEPKIEVPYAYGKIGEAVEGQEIYKLTSEIKLFW